MTDRGASVFWRFVRFYLFVTGKGEEVFMPSFLRSLTESGNCTFKVGRRIGQRSPIRSEKRKLRMVGKGQTLTDRDAEIGLGARRLLESKDDAYVILIDDLERARTGDHRAVFDRYRQIFDTILPEPIRNRAAVHFLVNMIEAYYFAHADAVNAVLGTELSDFDGDVETIPHPKNQLKSLFRGFDEKEHGTEIVRRLDLPRILSNPETCASLRTLFAWCVHAMGNESEDRFRLRDGVLSPVTRGQIAD